MSWNKTRVITGIAWMLAVNAIAILLEDTGKYISFARDNALFFLGINVSLFLLGKYVIGHFVQGMILQIKATRALVRFGSAASADLVDGIRSLHDAFDSIPDQNDAGTRPQSGTAGPETSALSKTNVVAALRSASNLIEAINEVNSSTGGELEREEDLRAWMHREFRRWFSGDDKKEHVEAFIAYLRAIRGAALSWAGGIPKELVSSAAVVDVRRGDVAKLRTCLNNGADANWRTAHGPGFHLLDIAILHGHLEIVNILLGAGADPNAKNDDGSTPVHTAASVARPAIMYALLEAGGNPDERDDEDATALHGATMFGTGRVPRSQRITDEDELVFGADPAVERQDPVDVARILIDAGADPNAEIRDGGGTPVHFLALRDRGVPATERNSGIIEALVATMKNGGADINRKTAGLANLAPIHMAVRTGPDAVRILLKEGADPDAEALHGATALHHAVRVHGTEPGGCLDSTKALLEGGANPNSRTWTGVQTDSYKEHAFRAAEELDAAMGARGHGNETWSDLLSSFWTDAVGGLTPLHVAARLNLADAVRVLRLSGADEDLVDENEMTPLEVAERWNCVDAAAALRERLDREPGRPADDGAQPPD